jgi:plasmid stabilization system protein ParE
MKRTLVLRGIAAAEFDAAIAGYEADHKGLGVEFRAIIEGHFQRIVENPEWFRKLRGEVRRLVVPRRFPYVIHFRIEPDQIVILSVFHTSRDPDQLKCRK